MSKAQIISPLPGTFYRKTSPESPPFKQDGDPVSAADVIGLVEVMKNFQEVTADAEGRGLVEGNTPLLGFSPEEDQPGRRRCWGRGDLRRIGGAILIPPSQPAARLLLKGLLRDRNQAKVQSCSMTAPV